MSMSRTTRILLLASIVTLMVLCAFLAGVGATWLLLHGSTASADEASEFGVFWQAWHLVEENFFGELPDMQHVTWGAIRGAIDIIAERLSGFIRSIRLLELGWTAET